MQTKAKLNTQHMELIFSQAFLVESHYLILLINWLMLKQINQMKHQMEMRINKIITKIITKDENQKE